MKGRFLHNNFGLAKETIKHLRRKNIYNLLLKLDIAKAFDTVAWQFLFQVKQHVGFGNKWRTWIAMLLSSALTSILLNGIPGQFFRHAKIGRAHV